MPSPKPIRIAMVATISGALGLVVLSLSNALTGENRVEAISQITGVRPGSLLGAGLGALVGAWLALGGTRRIARFAGLLLSVLVVVAVLRILRPFGWILDVIMRSLVGEVGSAYSPALVLFVLVLAWRPLVRGISGAISDVMQRSNSRPARAHPDPGRFPSP